MWRSAIRCFRRQFSITTSSGDSVSGDKRAKVIFLYVAITALVLFRTLSFLLYGREVMDGDEGLFALMAKQLAEGRAFPIFGYGSTYNFALSSWLAAPVIALFGTSIAAVKAPIIAMNLVVANGSAFLLRKSAGLGVWETLLCCLWLALPSFESSRGLMDNCIGGIEPFFFIGLIWVLRKRPVLAGFLAGIEAVQRPYVFYGVVALGLIQLIQEGPSRIRQVLASGFVWVASIGAGMALIQGVARYSSNYFGLASPLRAKRPIFMLEDLRGYFAEIIPKTIGLQTQRLGQSVLVARDELARSSHFNPLGLALSVLGFVLLVLACRFAWKMRKVFPEFLAREDLEFPLYLLLVGIFSFLAYVLASPPSPDIRFTFLLLAGFCGGYALCAKLSRQEWVRALAVLFVLGCFVNNFLAGLKGWKDLARLDKLHPERDLVAYLQSRGVGSAVIDFASAYQVAFFSGEKIAVTDSADGGRIPANARIYLSTPPARRAWVMLKPCGPDAVRVANWWVCVGPSIGLSR